MSQVALFKVGTEVAMEAGTAFGTEVVVVLVPVVKMDLEEAEVATMVG